MNYWEERPYLSMAEPKKLTYMTSLWLDPPKDCGPSPPTEKAKVKKKIK